MFSPRGEALMIISFSAKYQHINNHNYKIDQVGIIIRSE